MIMHKSITATRIIEALEMDDCIGFCTACGEEQCGCEPDARGYVCESCGKPRVYGAEELLMETSI